MTRQSDEKAYGRGPREREFSGIRNMSEAKVRHAFLHHWLKSQSPHFFEQLQLYFVVILAMECHEFTITMMHCSIGWDHFFVSADLALTGKYLGECWLLIETVHG